MNSSQSLTKSAPAGNFSAEQRQLLQRELELEEELLARRCLTDTYVWLTEGTKTLDEQDETSNPTKPFPMRRYIRPFLDSLDNERVCFIAKSRSMLASWLVAGWCTHMMCTRPGTRVVYQSEDEKRALDMVKYTKILWHNSIRPLQARWKLQGDMPLQDFAKQELRLANDSSCLGLVGNPHKVRSEHPTIYVADEAAFMTRFNASLSAAMATRCLHAICLSSAEPGEFFDIVESARPINWPAWKKS